MSFHITVTKPV